MDSKGGSATYAHLEVGHFELITELVLFQLQEIGTSDAVSLYYRQIPEA